MSLSANFNISVTTRSLFFLLGNESHISSFFCMSYNFSLDPRRYEVYVIDCLSGLYSETVGLFPVRKLQFWHSDFILSKPVLKVFKLMYIVAPILRLI